MQIKPLTEEMTAARADIIAQLQRDILPLEGYKAIPGGMDTGIGLGAINAAFPNGQFPLGAEHEFICKGAEQKVSAGGFISGILAALMNGVVCPSGSLKCVRYFRLHWWHLGSRRKASYLLSWPKKKSYCGQWRKH